MCEEKKENKFVSEPATSRGVAVFNFFHLAELMRKEMVRDRTGCDVGARSELIAVTAVSYLSNLT
jgi:hypothetical protein